MKASAKFFKGIEYVVTTELSAEQQALLEGSGIERIKILIDGKIVSNCIQYGAYEDWYHTKFQYTRKMLQPVEQEKASIPQLFHKQLST